MTKAATVICNAIPLVKLLLIDFLLQSNFQWLHLSNTCSPFVGGKGGKKKKTKAGSKPTKANGSNWANVPLPPPPVHPLPGTEMDHYPNEHHEGGGYVKYKCEQMVF